MGTGKKISRKSHTLYSFFFLFLLALWLKKERGVLFYDICMLWSVYVRVVMPLLCICTCEIR